VRLSKILHFLAIYYVLLGVLVVPLSLVLGVMGPFGVPAMAMVATFSAWWIVYRRPTRAPWMPR
jgi:hypothetical protein